MMGGTAIFQTEKGSMYYRLVSGLWRREGSDGSVYKNMFYFGSINESENPAFENRGLQVDLEMLLRQYNEMKEGGRPIPGFLLGDFRLGYVPFGCTKVRVGVLKDIRDVSLNSGRLVLVPHVGHRITRVFEQ